MYWIYFLILHYFLNNYRYEHFCLITVKKAVFKYQIRLHTDNDNIIFKPDTKNSKAIIRLIFREFRGLTLYKNVIKKIRFGSGIETLDN